MGVSNELLCNIHRTAHKCNLAKPNNIYGVNLGASKDF